jgi:F0F1-type ATP synthase assembly protein I
MKQAAVHPTTKSPRGNSTTALSTIGKDLIDTAWRIAVPVVLFAIIGLILDKNIGTAPWLTLAFTAAGFFVAGLLVKKQLKTVEEREAKL